MTQYKNVNEKYLATLTMLWNNAKELYKLSSNPGNEIYRLQTIVYSFAKQVVKVKDITKRRDEAQEAKDLSELRRIKFISDRMSDEKAFAMLWDTVSEDYDSILEAFKKESEAVTKAKTSKYIEQACLEGLMNARAAIAEEIDIDL